MRGIWGRIEVEGMGKVGKSGGRSGNLMRIAVFDV